MSRPDLVAQGYVLHLRMADLWDFPEDVVLPSDKDSSWRQPKASVIKNDSEIDADNGERYSRNGRGRRGRPCKPSLGTCHRAQPLQRISLDLSDDDEPVLVSDDDNGLLGSVLPAAAVRETSKRLRGDDDTGSGFKRLQCSTAPAWAAAHPATSIVLPSLASDAARAALAQHAEIDRQLEVVRRSEEHPDEDDDEDHEAVTFPGASDLASTSNPGGRLAGTGGLHSRWAMPEPVQSKASLLTAASSRAAAEEATSGIAEAVATCEPATTKLTFTCQTRAGHHVNINLARDAAFGKLMTVFEKHAQSQGWLAATGGGTLKFLRDGDRLHETNTPAELDMDDDEVIDVSW